MIEGVAIKLPQRGGRLSSNGGGARGVVQKSKLAENLILTTWRVSLQIGRLARTVEALGAIELAFLNNVEDGASLTLGDHFVALRELLLFHSIEHDIELGLVKSLEHKIVQETVLKLLFDCVRLRDNIGLKRFFLVELSKYFGADTNAFGIRARRSGHNNRKVTNIFFTLWHKMAKSASCY